MKAVMERTGGQPTCDELYEEQVRALLRSLSLSVGFTKEVGNRFREGPLALCSRAVGRWILQQLAQREWTQEMLADKLGVDRSAVTYWISGKSNITFANLLQVLIAFGCRWADLPLPTRQAMAVEAYLAALACVRQHIEQSPGAPLDHERFWCLYHLFADRGWELAVRRQDPEQLHKEAERILAAARQRLQGPVREFQEVCAERRAPLEGATGLQQLLREWGRAWLVCIKKVPRSWDVL